MYFCISRSFALIEMFDAFGSLDILNLFSLFWCRKWPAQKNRLEKLWLSEGLMMTSMTCGLRTIWTSSLLLWCSCSLACNTSTHNHDQTQYTFGNGQYGKIILSVCNMKRTHGRFYMFMGYKLAKMVLWTWIWLWSRTGSGIPLRNPGQRTCYIDAPAITTFEC